MDAKKKAARQKDFVEQMIAERGEKFRQLVDRALDARRMVGARPLKRLGGGR